MAQNQLSVTDAELAVLQALWEQGPATIRQLTDRLYPGGRASDFATVQKLLERLEGKRCARRERQAGGLRFEATVDREELMGRWLRAMAEKLCHGSLMPLLTYLVQGPSLTAQERRALRALVEKAAKEKKKD
jgi:predicted transcriptional regulator